MQRHTISQGKPCIANIRKEIKEDAMQRYTIFDRKTCIANMNNGRRPCTVQRHTISGREPCIASTERGRSTDAVQRYTIFDRKTCIANMNNGRRPCTVQRHTISGEKNCVASTERKKKTNRSHTTLHNTIRSSHKTTTHHITSYHIISQPYPNPTTLPTDKTPYHASNTIHYNTIQQKAPPPKLEEELYWSVCEPTKLAECVPIRAPKRGQRRRGWRRLTP